MTMFLSQFHNFIYFRTPILISIKQLHVFDLLNEVYTLYFIQKYKGNKVYGYFSYSFILFRN